MPRTKSSAGPRATLREQNAKLEEQNRLLRQELAARREAADLRTEPSANDPVMFGALAQSIVAGLPLKEFAIKATIGFIYGYTLGVAGQWAVGAFALLAMPVWINFVVAVLITMAVIYVGITTIMPTSNFVYNTGAKTLGFIKRETLAARDWVERTAHDVRTEVERRKAAREIASGTVAAH
jgi:hypothetical protein